MATVLTINGGSSSIRFALYDVRDVAKKLLGGKIDCIGLPGCTMTVDEVHYGATARSESSVGAADHVDLMKLQPDTEHPHGLSNYDFDSLFTHDKPV